MRASFVPARYSALRQAKYSTFFCFRSTAAASQCSQRLRQVMIIHIFLFLRVCVYVWRGGGGCVCMCVFLSPFVFC